MTIQVKQFAHRVKRWTNRQNLFLQTLIRSRFEKDFDDVETFVMFVGYARSGHSLIGSLLDAHPQMIIAHELDVLKYLRHGFSKPQLYQLLLDNSRSYAANVRTETGYNYDVPGQWQGRYQKLKIIGDKKGGRTAYDIDANPDLLPQLISRIDDVPIKVIHIIRNPFDVIGRMTKWNHDQGGAIPVENVIRRFFRCCNGVEIVRNQIPPENFFETRSEAFIDAPQDELRAMCYFLELDAPQDYLDACASIIFNKKRLSRHAIEWTPQQIDAVYQQMADYPYLDGYRFEA